jgi:hypothetical protein
MLTLPAGTEITVDRLVIHKEDLGGPPAYIMGSLVSGPYAGKAVQLDDKLFCPNPFTFSSEKKPSSYTKQWVASPDKLSK